MPANVHRVKQPVRAVREKIDATGTYNKCNKNCHTASEMDFWGTRLGGRGPIADAYQAIRFA
jgi:hypothetical protein